MIYKWCFVFFSVFPIYLDDQTLLLKGKPTIECGDSLGYITNKIWHEFVLGHFPTINGNVWSEMNDQPFYSRRFATATARTALLGSHSRGMIQGRSGKWSGGVEARRALLSDGLPSHEGSPVVTMGVFNTKSWSNGRFGANIAPWRWTPAILSQKISPFP